jgi:tetratricopeptide (TPR) repeat protein
MLEEESANKKDFVKDIGNSFKNELKKDPFGKKLQRWKYQIITLIEKLKKARDIVKNNYELGRKYYELGNFDDAVIRFKFLTWMEPKHADGWYWLGASYMAVDKKQNAVTALRKALATRPDFPEARDLLKAASGAA